jgi:hypothetical protein
MNGVEYLDEYQNAVLEELKKIPWAATVGVYPELPDDFETPAIFLDVSRWSRSETEIGGNVTLALDCILFIVRHIQSAEGVDETETGSTETRVRNAALKMSDWIHGRQFGIGTASASFENAEPMAWQSGDETRADHAIWAVNYSQLLAVGVDIFDEPDAPIMKEFWLGVFPDVGADHKDDYELIAKSEEG